MQISIYFPRLLPSRTPSRPDVSGKCPSEQGHPYEPFSDFSQFPGLSRVTVAHKLVTHLALRFLFRESIFAFYRSDIYGGYVK